MKNFCTCFWSISSWDRNPTSGFGLPIFPSAWNNKLYCIVLVSPEFIISNSDQTPFLVDISIFRLWNVEGRPWNAPSTQTNLVTITSVRCLLNLLVFLFNVLDPALILLQLVARLELSICDAWSKAFLLLLQLVEPVWLCREEFLGEKDVLLGIAQTT